MNANVDKQVLGRLGLGWAKIIPFVIGLSLLLSISTNLRMASFPVGPGEILLALLAIVGALFGKPWRLWKTPVVLFWVLASMGMMLGALVTAQKGSLAAHHAMAYAFTAGVTIGLVALLMQLSDVALKRAVSWLCTLTAAGLWFGFVVYLSGDVALAKNLLMADGGDVRYSGWSINPNQLALFFVPLPVWVAALWRDVATPTRLQMAGFALLLFALMLMGLLVRSDGLFVVWVFEFVILIMLRLRWEMKASRMSLLGYALVMVLCVFLVKTFAHGEVRKSVRCAVETISQGEGLWSARCYDGQAFKDQEAFRIGYSNPVEKTGVRQQLWTHGLQIWLQSPWVGHGPGEYSWHSTGVNGERSGIMESHNITIDLLTQGGILAGGAWLALVSYLLIGAWRIRDSYTFSVVLMMAAFTFFHNTRQPYFWFVLAFSHEAIRRGLFVTPPTERA
jgi:O-Antigen ligase